MEQEFWNAIHESNENKDFEEVIYSSIVREINRNVSKEFPYLELKLQKYMITCRNVGVFYCVIY